MRIVSLLPSATEIVCALGAESSLVGRSSECDFPASVREVPAVMRAKTADLDRPSAEIDRRVQRVRSRDESLYYLDIALLRSTHPDLLLTQDLCSVCSVTESEAASACETAGVSPRVLSLSPRTFPDVWDSIVEVGRAVGAPDRAETLAETLRRGSTSPERSIHRVTPTVAIVEWVDPPILAGLWANGMAVAAGSRSIGPSDGEVGVRTTWSNIRAQRPDLVVISPCSFTVDRTRRELERSQAWQEWGPRPPPLGCWLADEAFFSRPGPRLSEGVALLRGLVNRTPPTVSMRYERWAGRGNAS